jgi:putative spermidine/putrescine transport system ATP-binding protein
MSDRIAVFDRGKIQQIDKPAAIYERPKNSFVADFVGVSNLITGSSATAILGKSGTYTVRPERITLGDVVSGQRVANGVIKEVEYLGPATRFLVELDTGISLVALRQNTSQSSVDVEALRNTKTTLSWDISSEYEVAG